MTDPRPGADEDIRVERRDRVSLVTFDRPEVLNAFRGRTYDRLLEILAELARDQDTRVVVLTGTGRAFCAGTDLRELAADAGGAGPETAGAGPDANAPGATRFSVERNQEITRRLVALPQITIAAVNGPAVGFGAELAVASDIRVASEGARFAFPEVQRGLYLTNGVTWLLPRIVGLGRAMEWLATGRQITAAEALGAGLVTEYVSRDRLLELAFDIAAAIASCAPISVRMVKRALHDPPADLEAALEAEARDVLVCRETDDWAEGVRSFLEKRGPEFRGR